MPIYEFDCQACGARFDRLVDAGAESAACRACGSAESRRVMSSLAPLPKLAKSGGTRAKQESQNRRLHQGTKARFKERRRKAREARAAKRP